MKSHYVDIPSTTDDQHLYQISNDSQTRTDGLTTPTPHTTSTAPSVSDVFATMLGHSLELISINDTDGLVRYINPAVQQVLGYTPEEMIGTYSTDYVHPDDLARVTARMKRDLNGEGGENYLEMRFRHRDGSWRMLEAYALDLRHDPQIQGILVRARDVTDYRWAVWERDQIFHFTQSLLIIVATETSMIVQVNPAWQQLLGYDPQALINTSILDLLHPDDYPQAHQSFDTLQREGLLHGLEMRLRHHDGSYRWLRWNANYDPVLHLSYAIGQDITLQRTQSEQLRLLGNALEYASDAVLITDAELDLPGPRILFANQAFTRITGYTAAEVLGKTPRILQGPRSDRKTLDRLKANLRQGKEFRGSTINYRKDGTPFAVEWSVMPLCNDAGEVTNFVSIQRDRTEELAIQQFELDQHAVLELVIRGHALQEVLQRIVGMLDEQYSTWAISLRLFQNDWQDVQADFGITMPRLGSRSAPAPREQPALYPMPSNCHEFPIVLRDHLVAGVLRCCTDAGTAMHDIARGQFETASRLIALAIEHEKLNRRLVYYIHQDELTGLPNRTRCLEYLQQTINMQQSFQPFLAVCLIDLDNFTQINEFYGHQSGDDLLVLFADRLRLLTPADDFLARISNDEFVWVMQSVATEQESVRQAQELIEQLRAPFRIDGHDVSVQMHIGISFFPSDSTDPLILLQRADNALQQARRHPHHKVMCFAPDMTASTLLRLSRERQLRRAIQRDELVLYYQPQYHLRSGALTGFEALVRWQLPDGTMMPPGEFIPIAEESGLILDIGKWVLRAACRQSAMWQQQGLPPVRVAVNISALQLAQSDFVAQVQQSLDEFQLDPHWLELELTETLLMQDYQLAAAQLSQLRELGVRVAIDDFGTGYSSLAYLQRLPVDALKIDRVFIDQLLRDSNDHRSLSPDGVALVSAMITLAHNFHLQVIAEGVESSAQVSILNHLECDVGQGYVLGRPLPTAAVTEIIRAQQISFVEEAHANLAE